jgi:DNA-directed RNA polymerase subunit RPC12/RpoP
MTNPAEEPYICLRCFREMPEDYIAEDDQICLDCTMKETEAEASDT